MNLANVAGTVATNENFLGALTGALGRDAEFDQGIVDFNDRIRQNNQEHRVLLNAVRRQYGLAEIQPLPATNQGAAAGVPPPVSTNPLEKNVLTLRNENTALWKTLDGPRGELRGKIQAAIKAAENLTPELRGKIESQLQKLKKLVEEVATDSVLNVPPQTASEVESSLEAFTAKYDEIKRDLGTLQSKLREYVAHGTSLISLDKSQERVIEQVKLAEKWLNELQTIQL
jgi:hypothetical protein